jgi:hypothetical protein
MAAHGLETCFISTSRARTPKNWMSSRHGSQPNIRRATSIFAVSVRPLGQTEFINHPQKRRPRLCLRESGPWPKLIAAGRFLMSGFPTVAFAAVVMSSHAMAHPVVPTEQKFNVGMWPSRQ